MPKPRSTFAATARRASAPATQDPGTGTYTILAQIVSDKTGIPTDKIQVALGDSSFVPGPTSGGSTATATIIPAVADAANSAIRIVLASATSAKGSPFLDKDPASLAMTAGRVHAKGQSPESGVPFQDVLRMANLASANGDGKSGGLGSDTKARDYSTHSFGAQFVEVEWDPGIARLRVSRVVSVIDGGRILNKKTATNQIAGAVVMGVGMGLLEQTIYDPRNGHPINDNFADYIVPTHADSPDIDVVFLDIPDPMMGEYGARGIGEIGLAGVCSRHHGSGLSRHRCPRPRAACPNRRPSHLPCPRLATAKDDQKAPVLNQRDRCNCFSESERTFLFAHQTKTPHTILFDDNA